MFKVLVSFVSIALFCVALAAPFYSAQARADYGPYDGSRPNNKHMMDTHNPDGNMMNSNGNMDPDMR